MKWVNGNIYNYTLELDEHPQQSSMFGRRGLYRCSTIDAYFLLLNFIHMSDQSNDSITFLVLSATGSGSYYKKWQDGNNNGVVTCHIDNHIGFTNVTDKYSKEDLKVFRQMRKVLLG